MLNGRWAAYACLILNNPSTKPAPKGTQILFVSGQIKNLAVAMSHETNSICVPRGTMWVGDVDHQYF